MFLVHLTVNVTKKTASLNRQGVNFVIEQTEIAFGVLNSISFETDHRVTIVCAECKNLALILIINGAITPLLLIPSWCGT